jgi:hypothetical protein
MPYRLGVSRVFLLLTVSFLTAAAHAQLPPKSIAAPESWVKDQFIAYVHGLVYGDYEMDVAGETFRNTYPEFDTDRWTPFDELTRIRRTRAEDGTFVSIEFEKPMEHTVEAVNILGWRPVRLVGTQRIVGAELHADAPNGAHLRPLAREHGVDDLVVFPLVDSRMRVDIADWVDAILGPLVDDIEVRLVAVARKDDVWYGIMGGVNAQSVPKTGIHNLTQNQFELDPPEDVAELAVKLVETTLP